MPDYSKGVIYMLEPTVEYEAGDVYYGSTIQPLYKRLFHHKSTRTTSSKHLFEKYGNNIKIVLVKTFPCNSKLELHAEEGKYIRENKCVNKRVAGRSTTEYYQDNKEEKKEYGQKHYQDHKEVSKSYYQEHKEEKKAYSKAYHQDRKEEINQKIKCVCGCMVVKRYLNTHKRSKKHTQLLTNVITSQ